MTLTDKDLMPIGKKYKHVPMEKVPAGYLLFMWDDTGLWDRMSLYSEEYFAVHDYIKENFTVLVTECKDRIVKHLP
jgi:hypothetical protein